MKLSANGWNHVGLRVTDLARAKRFYVDTLGCPLVREIEGAVFVTVAGLLIALLGADAHTPGADHFDTFRVGLDHLALARLRPWPARRDAAGIRRGRGTQQWGRGRSSDPSSLHQLL
jgi:catechol 2,3-dioxygenase-like lactoylglutathione lyase family enzyme